MTIKNSKIKILLSLIIIVFLTVSCGLFPSGPETTIKYFTFTFIVESDSCSYSSDAPTSYGGITKQDSSFVLKLKTDAESPGYMLVTNYSDSNEAYVNIQKAEGNRFVEKDYVVKPHEQISFLMNQ